MKRGPADLTELKITLTQAQCDVLAEEAEQNGLRFFDHCRLKLLAGLNQPLRLDPPRAEPRAEPKFEPRIEKPAPVARQDAPAPDRIDRLEAMMLHMSETITHLAQGRPAHDLQQSDEPGATQADFDAIMRSRLAEAESQGLTVPRGGSEQADAPDDSDYRTIGVRRFNRPAPPAFSSLGTSGRIQREGTPTMGA